MQPDPSDLDPQKLWQSQDTEHAPLSLADLHDKSRAFQARIRRRNIVEYLACVVVVLGFLPAVLRPDNWMIRAGATLIIIATASIAWQLHRRTSIKRGPEEGQALVDFYRLQLARQRDAVRSIAVWYLGPFTPGMTLLLTGLWFKAGSNRPMILLAATLTIASFIAIWLLNQRAARRLQQQIDALNVGSN